MFLPFVHQLGRHLGGFKEQPAWLTIGQVLDVDAAEIAAGATSAAPRAPRPAARCSRPSDSAVISPPAAARRGRPAAALELTEQGFYEIRGAGRDAGPVIVAASNVSLAESNLDRMDPQELVAAVTGNGRPAQRRARTSYQMRPRNWHNGSGGICCSQVSCF